jgi:hypothetical protein
VEIGSEWNTLGKKDVLPHWLLWLTDAWLQCLLGSPAWTVLARSWLSETYVLVKHYKEKKVNYRVPPLLRRKRTCISGQNLTGKIGQQNLDYVLSLVNQKCLSFVKI